MILGERCSGLCIIYIGQEEEIIKKNYRSLDVRTKYKQNWINYLERTDNNRLPKHALNYKTSRTKRS